MGASNVPVTPPATGGLVNRRRAPLIGGLVLGSGFDPRDLAAYAAGVAAAVVLDYARLNCHWHFFG